jgi:hypothetical protein
MRPLATVVVRTVLAASLVCAAAGASAQIPQKMNYQVMLTDDSDQPLADQTVSMVFTIYDDPGGGTALWTETQSVTTNSVGVVSVLLGDVHPIDFELVGPVWLGVEVDGEPLSPRRELATAPYAAYAANSAMLGGTDASEYALLSEVGGDGHSLDADDGSPVDAVYVDSLGLTHFSDVVEIGKLEGRGEIRLHDEGNANIGLWLYSDETGGVVRVQDESGALSALITPDPNVPGGILYVARNAMGDDGFTVEGNHYGEAPRVTITGPSQETVFDMSAIGDEMVQLPEGTVSSAETGEEPGVASAQSDSIIDLPTDVIYAVAERSITVPGSGYVFVMGTAQVDFDNFYVQSGHHVHFGVSEVADAFSSHAQESSIMLWDGAPIGWYDYHVAVSGLFEVTPGTHTFYLNARENDGFCYVTATQLTLMYFPTAYGTVDMDD